MKYEKTYDYDGKPIQIKNIDGKIMINAYQMVGVFNKPKHIVKLLDDWFAKEEQLQCVDALLKAGIKDDHIDQPDEQDDIWIHQLLALRLSLHLDYKFHFFVMAVFEETKEEFYKKLFAIETMELIEDQIN